MQTTLDASHHSPLGTVGKLITNLTAISFHPCTANTKQGTHNGISFFRGLRTTISALRLSCAVVAHGKQEDSTIRPSSLSDTSHPPAGWPEDERIPSKTGGLFDIASIYIKDLRQTFIFYLRIFYLIVHVAA